MEIKDAIATVFNSDLGVFRKENFRKFRRQGAEMELRYRISNEWEVFGSGAFNHVVNRTTGRIVRGNGTARQSFRLGADYRSRKGFGANLYGYYDRWDSAASLEPNDRKFIFDAKLSQDFGRVGRWVEMEIFLNIHNIANSKYWSSKNFPLPGRYFEGGVTVEF
jgi:outer membrane receptor protein involved in Fe transport